MQWIRKIQAATNRDTLSLAEPPSLLAKLDGNAETVSGDVLTGYRGRFLLLEFKSSKSLCVTEKETSRFTLFLLGLISLNYVEVYQYVGIFLFILK